MAIVALVTLLLLFQFIYFMGQAGAARGKENVSAPAMTGSDLFDRKSRVHLNTLEQLMIALPAMWICAHFFRADVAAALGVVFLIGRFVYASAYVKDPSKRGTGMMIGFTASVLMLFLSLWGVVTDLL